MRLEGKVAIVTGAAKGLGGEMAQTFAREGARVIAADMMPLTYECENVEFYQLNVTDGEACKGLFEYAKEKFGKIDILVNNAGITRDAM
ncbi:MAG: SDR family NAD(P)-dependent oxidoreductase, partial [Clostridia bacterium]|nr:SDR family NAD(P)-dependent oxidoreductase [Clostridia bacterium]